jgi:hypothetical protein
MERSGLFPLKMILSCKASKINRVSEFAVVATPKRKKKEKSYGNPNL